MAFTFSELIEPLAGLTTSTQIILGLDDTEALLVRNAGDTIDTFKVDTIANEVEMDAATALCWSNDVMLWREGPDVLALRRGNNDQTFYIYNQFTDSSNYERLALYAGGTADFFIETQTAGTGQDTTILRLINQNGGSFEFYTDGLGGGLDYRLGPARLDFSQGQSIGSTISLRPSIAHIATSVNIGLTKTVEDDAIILEMANLTIDGFTDSQAVRWTGQSRDSSVNIDSDWKAFVDMVANDGTGSLWTLQQRIDAGGYVTKLTVDDAGVLNAVALSAGTTPAAAGSVRIPNAGSLTMRNSANNGDLNIWNSPMSDEIEMGDTNIPIIRMISGSMEIRNQLTILATANGDATTILRNTTTVSTPSGASATAASFIPAGALLLAITARVITAITGPAGFDLGDGVIVDRWGNSILTALGTTVDVNDYTSSALQLYPAANDVVITSDGVDFTGGNVRLTAHYIAFTAPTS